MMEERLTFTRVPRSVYWLCNYNFQQARKSYTAIIDHFQQDPFLVQILSRVLPLEKGRKAMEAQLVGYGVKGFRDKLCELYLTHLETGRFPDEARLERVLEVQQFEERFESFASSGDFRLFMLGMYLKMKDFESQRLFGRQTNFLNIPVEVDEILSKAPGKVQRIDWVIVILNSLLKVAAKEELSAIAEGGEEALVETIVNLDEKDKLVLLNDLMAYGHALDEKDFFLYQKI